MKHFLRSVFVGVVLVLLTAAPAFPQATGELAGRVTDESSAVLPGVTVTAVQTETGLTRTAATDAEGNWVMPNMPTGPYRLDVALSGYLASRASRKR